MMNRHTERFLTLGFALWLVGAATLAQETPKPADAAQQASPAAEAPLTNADVVKLCKLDLGDEVVIAKINQANAVDFELDTDSLIALKQEGASKDVIAAMLKRMTPVVPAPAPSSAAIVQTVAVRLETASGAISLTKMMGQMSQGVMGWVNYMDFPGLTARSRTSDGSPTIVVLSNSNPSGQFFVGKLDPAKRSGTRSLKMGHGVFGAKSVNTPDPDWTVPYEVTEGPAGSWRLKLLKVLKPGEYGVYVADPNVLNSGELYDFGVD
jgi:hypothetical protein